MNKSLHTMLLHSHALTILILTISSEHLHLSFQPMFLLLIFRRSSVFIHLVFLSSFEIFPFLIRRRNWNDFPCNLRTLLGLLLTNDRMWIHICLIIPSHHQFGEKLVLSYLSPFRSFVLQKKKFAVSKFRCLATVLQGKQTERKIFCFAYNAAGRKAGRKRNWLI